jgi:nucleoside-diphosphate-sugar epimerase
MAGGRRRVLITGAAGRIGSDFRRLYGHCYDFRLIDRRPIPDPAGHEPTVGDLAEIAVTHQACAGVDTVLHLAADPNSRADFYETLLAMNVEATYNIFAAARQAGCRRVIFASSIHAVNAYPLDVQVHADDPVRPGDMYGVTKVFGEATAAYFAYREGLNGIAVRIGAYGPPESVAHSDDSRLLSLWVSPRDLAQLFHRCIEAPDTLKFAILHGVSNNQLKRLDISTARELVGYAPQDNAFALSEMTRLKEWDPGGEDV